MVKAQTSLRSSLEIQRLSFGHADNLHNSNEVMLIKRASSESVEIKPFRLSISIECDRFVLNLSKIDKVGQ